MFCNGLGIAPCAVHYLDIVLLTVLNIDVVRSDRMTDDAFSFRIQDNK